MALKQIYQFVKPLPNTLFYLVLPLERNTFDTERSVQKSQKYMLNILKSNYKLQQLLNISPRLSSLRYKK